MLDNYMRFGSLLKQICLNEASAQSDILFSGTLYKFCYLFTYLLTVWFNN